jgi:hypothetical protein
MTTTVDHWHTHSSTGKIYRVRRSGKTKTWKTRPGEFRIPVKCEFRIPVKYGLYQSFYITHENAHEWIDGEDCHCND